MNRHLTIPGRWLPVVVALLLTGCNLEVEHYQSSWLHRAHQLQRQLDQEQPLRRATFIATHNSYNAAAYTTAQSYYDPNQIHSITAQLEMDVRALELDVHSVFGQLLLCHGTDQHIGCSPFDRPLAQGLQEIVTWLQQPKNQDAVLLLYIEDHSAARDRAELAQRLLDLLGPYTYLPATPLAATGGCPLIPAGLSKAQLRAAGKNILILSDGCSSSELASVLFGGFAGADDDSGYPTLSLSMLQPAPACVDSALSQPQVQQTFLRMQEDRTLLSRLVGNAGSRITAPVVANLLDCEINLLGLDKLRPGDGRLRAALWSWAEGQPAADAHGRCALHNDDGHFQVAPCAGLLPYSCRDESSGQWVLSHERGPWDAGAAVCDALGLQFAVPFSAYDNRRLQGEKVAGAVNRAWLGYRQRGGQWQPATD
ncbi:MAG: hypothetical protein VXY23_15555 [Pseudomonadota bacterium]|jgi:hypothetical protein|nr:hypothetical protein [Pseudomonadota bacterium]HAU16019.1 hypothetical protein [Gammaproteobacteria bacterium]|tara:strand:+ start:20477 stop:21751 length:1275 start_codon:yes stop_codon:yes gene_type:complete